MKIDPHKEYRVSEVANNGWILTERRTKSYRHILRRINQGVLPAREYKIPGFKSYYILGADIIEYNKKFPIGSRVGTRLKKAPKQPQIRSINVAT